MDIAVSGPNLTDNSNLSDEDKINLIGHEFVPESEKALMNITPFEQLKITTMTLVVPLIGSVDTDTAFHLLPITRIQAQMTRVTSKCRLPHCSIPGSILSIRYRNNVRGIIRSTGTPFKNSVTIDISTSKKNISLKLSASSIQLCGASSVQDGSEAVNHVLNHLKRIQELINRIHVNPEGYQRILNWVKTNTKGEATIKEKIQTKELNGLVFNFHRQIPAHSILLPKSYLDLPDDADRDLVGFLLSFASDFLYHEDYCVKLDCIQKVKTLISEDLGIKQIDEAMVNYNYNLGFEVDRAKLCKLVDQRSYFSARFNIELVHNVTVELPYTPRSDSSLKVKKGVIPHFTFLVYKSGSTTMSGPATLLIREAYYMFMKIITEIKDEIIYKRN